MEKRQLDLIISSLDLQRYHVQARNSEGGTVSADFDLNLSSGVVRSLLDGLKESIAKTNHRFDRESLKALGRILFDAVLSGSIHTFYEAERGGNPKAHLRIILNVESAELQPLPWELMYDSQRESWLSRDPEIKFCRSISLPTATRRVELESPLRVLLVLSNPLGLGELELDLDKERDKLATVFSHHNAFELTVLEEEVTLETIYRKLFSERTNVLHFSGHGANLENQKLVLVLEDLDGRQKQVPFDDFLSILPGLSDLGAVILDSCELAVGAPRILTKKVPIVIAMRESILDETATIFFEEFYNALSTGLDVDEAVTHARINLVARYGEEMVDWFTPVLYLGSNAKVHLKAQTSPKIVFEKRRNDDLSALRNPARFVGRRKKLLELREKLSDLDTRIITLEGLSGEGKTTLISKLIMNELDSFEAVFSRTILRDTTFERLSTDIVDFLEENGDHGLIGLWNRPDVGFAQKVALLVDALANGRYLIFLDGFQNMLDGKTVIDENMESFLTQIITRKMSSKVIISTWERFEIAGGRYLSSLYSTRLGPLEFDEGIRMINNLGLKDLDENVKRDIIMITGGSPVFLEAFIGLQHRIPLDDLLANHSLFARHAYEKLGEQIVRGFKKDESLAIKLCSLLRVPVPLSLLECLKIESDTVMRLSDMFFINVDASHKNYKVHESLSLAVQAYLRSESEEDYRRLRLQVGTCYEAMGEQRKNVWELLESRHHFIEAGQGDKASRIVRRIAPTLNHWGYGELAIKLSEESSLQSKGTEKAVLLLNLSVYYFTRGQYDLALKKSRESLALSRELGEQVGIAASIYEIGNIHTEKGELEEAMGMYKEVIDMNRESPEVGGMNKAYHAIGNIHSRRGELEEAMDMYNESLKLARRDKDKIGISATLHAIGTVHLRRKELEDGIRMHMEGLEIEKETGDILGIGKTYGTFSNVWMMTGDYKKAIRSGLIALRIFKRFQSPDLEVIASNLSNLKDRIGEEEFDKISREAELEITTEILRYEGTKSDRGKLLE